METLPYKPTGYFGIIKESSGSHRIVGKYAENIAYASFKTCQKATVEVASRMEKNGAVIERVFVVTGTPTIQWDPSLELTLQ